MTRSLIAIALLASVSVLHAQSTQQDTTKKAAPKPKVLTPATPAKAAPAPVKTTAAPTTTKVTTPAQGTTKPAAAKPAPAKAAPAPAKTTAAPTQAAKPPVTTKPNVTPAPATKMAAPATQAAKPVTQAAKPATQAAKPAPQTAKPAASAAAQAARGPDGDKSTQVAERGSKGEVSFLREEYDYSRKGRRDPFVSLLATGDLRPLLADLRLVAVAYDPTGRNSVAVMRDVGTKDQYRVKVGQTLGRMQVSQIQPKAVVFTVEEFGFRRTEVLAIGDSTRARGQ
jgi:hypothetical protein